MLDDLGHNEADEDKGSPPPIIFAQLRTHSTQTREFDVMRNNIETLFGRQ